MDPVSIVGIVNASVDLALKCASSVKTLNDLASKYSNAKLTILSVTQNLVTMQFAWNRIGEWVDGQKSSETADEVEFIRRIAGSLDTGTLVMDALGEFLSDFDVDQMTVGHRIKVVWNENVLQAHQNCIRDQAASMTLLLQAIQLYVTSMLPRIKAYRC